MTLQTLFENLQQRRDKQDSYTAQLLGKGADHVARKFGEEAIELIVAAVAKKPAEVVEESADMLYHWLVLLMSQGITPDQIWAALEKRQHQSGLAEKASR
jgi:phosphoribosyl-ATP pyrophosphohydrolase